MGSYFYLVGGGLLILAFLLGRSSGGNSLRARDISGNAVVGDTSGSVYQGELKQPPSRREKKASGDWIAWVIGAVGVLIAIAQLVHDLWK